MNQDEKTFKLHKAVETADPRTAGRLIMELVLDTEDDTSEIAADFIENAVGRFDWVNNWNVIKAKEDPVEKVKSYLDAYGLVADAQQIVNTIDQMAAENPGRWK